MVTNSSHEVARHGNSNGSRIQQGAGDRMTGACAARVKIGKGLPLVIAFLISASANASASPDLPHKSTAFAYRVTHPVFPLPQSAIASLRDPDAGVLVPEVTAAWDFEEPTPAEVGAKPRVPTQPELCRTVANVANTHNLPVPFFANLIWAESSFNAKTISRAGAQGIAQFMPKTAVEYGLENPFDSVHAIKVSARFLTQLREQFGNLGLAAAAYNAGPRRVINWLAHRGSLPRETQNYVRKITGRAVDQWVGEEAVARAEIEPMPARAPCVEVAEAVLEQTRVARIANLMRELSASVPPPESAAGAVRRRFPGETKVAHGKPGRKSVRLAKLRPSVKDLSGRTQLAEGKPSKLEASSSSNRRTRAIRLAIRKFQKSEARAEMAADAPTQSPSKAPDKILPAKVAHTESGKPAAKPDATRHRHRAARPTRYAYSNDNGAY
jgi:hypothetical protein